MGQMDPRAAHSRRVGAVALEIASRLRLPPDECDALAQAALLHHYPPEDLDTKWLCRLLAGLQAGFPPGAAPAAPRQGVRAALEGLHGNRNGGPAPKLSRILEAANFFDERYEFLPYEPMTFDQTVDELDWMAKDGILDAEVVRALAGLPQVRMEELVAKMRRLPVFPAVALRALELTADQDSSFSQIEKIVSADQVLAGRIVQAANSGLYNPRRRIGSIRQAISYIGLDACRKVMMAALVQPLFGPGSPRELWKHSLAMAQLTERVALVAERIDGHEAFLAGLMHDVGRLALAVSRRDDAAVYQRMMERGCEPVYAELLLCGFEHGAIGAELLRSWAFPAQIVEAVERHHRPELGESALAAALYVAETASGSAEDIPSPARLEAAEKRLGERFAIPRGERPATPGWLDFLVEAA